MTDIAKLNIEINSSKAKQAKTDLDQLTRSGEQSERQMGTMSKAAARLGTALAAAFSVHKMSQFIKDTALLYARFETLGVVMNKVGQNAGYSAAEMASFEKSLRSSGIAAIESRTVLTRMTQAQIDLAQSSKLARIAQDAAVIGNINSSEAFERMIHGIQSAQVEVLRTIGLNVNFEQSYKKLADQLGISRNELSETQKAQARVNVVLQAGTAITGVYEASMNTAGKQLASMKRYTDDLKVSIGETFNEALVLIVKQATLELKAMQNTMKGLKEDGSLDDWGAGFANVVAGTMDIILLVTATITSVTSTISAAIKQLRLVAEAVYDILSLDFAGAKRNIQGFAEVGIEWWDKMEQKWTSPTFTDTLKKMRLEADITSKAFQDTYDMDFGSWADGLYESADGAEDLAEEAKKAAKQLKEVKKALDELGLSAALEKFETYDFSKLVSDAEVAAQISAETAAQFWKDEHEKAYADQVRMAGYSAVEIEEIHRKSAEAKTRAETAAYEKAQREQTRAQEKALAEQERKWKRAYDDMHKFAADTFYDLFDGSIGDFEDFTDKMLDIFKRMLANMVAEWMMSGLFKGDWSISGGSGGGLLGNIGTLFGGSGSGGGFNLSGLSNIGKLFGSGDGSLMGGLSDMGRMFGIGGTQMGVTGAGVGYSSYGIPAAHASQMGSTAGSTAGAGAGTGAAVGGFAMMAYMAYLAATAEYPKVTFQSNEDPFSRMIERPATHDRELYPYTYHNQMELGQKSDNFDYFLRWVDVDDAEAQKSVYDFFDNTFKSYEEMFGVVMNDVLKESSFMTDSGLLHKGGSFENMFSGVFENILPALITKLFEDSETVAQEYQKGFKFVDNPAYTGGIDDFDAGVRQEMLIADMAERQVSIWAEKFDAEFFKAMTPEGGSEFDTFARFGDAVQNTENFMEDFTRRTEEMGQSTLDAFNDIQTVSHILNAIQADIDALATSTAWQQGFDSLNLAFEIMIAQLNEAGATAEQVAEALAAQNQMQGAYLTGLTGASVEQALMSGGNISGIVAQSMKSMMASAFAGNLMESALNDFNDQVAAAFAEGGAEAALAVYQAFDFTALENDVEEFMSKFSQGIQTVTREADLMIAEILQGGLTASQMMEKWGIDTAGVAELFADITEGGVTREELEKSVKAFSDLGLEGKDLTTVISYLTDAFVSSANRLSAALNDIDDAKSTLPTNTGKSARELFEAEIASFLDLPNISDIMIGGTKTVDSRVFDPDEYVRVAVATANAVGKTRQVFDTNIYTREAIAAAKDQNKGEWTPSEFTDAVREGWDSFLHHFETVGGPDLGLTMADVSRSVDWTATSFTKAVGEMGMTLEEHSEKVGKIDLGIALEDVMKTITETVQTGADISSSEEEISSVLATLGKFSASDIINDFDSFSQALNDLIENNAEALIDIFGPNAGEMIRSLTSAHSNYQAALEQAAEATNRAADARRAATEAETAAERNRFEQIAAILGRAQYDLDTIGMSAFEKELFDIGNQTQEWIRRLEGLGAAEEDLAVIRKWGAEQVWAARDAYQADQLAEAEATLNATRDEYLGYLQKEIDLRQAAFDDARNVLQEYIDGEERLIDVRRQAAKSIDDFINGLMGSTKAPVQSMEFFEKRYAQLLSDAKTAEGDDIPGAVSALTGFTSQYLDFAGAYGGQDYNTLFNQVVGDLESVGADQLDQADLQTRELKYIKDLIGDTDDKLFDINEAIQAYVTAKTDLNETYWMTTELAHLQQIDTNMALLLDSMNSYYGLSGGTPPSMDPVGWLPPPPNFATPVPYTGPDWTASDPGNPRWGDDRYPMGPMFAGGGTISGPESGYTPPVTFHGKEHVVTDTNMQELKDILSGLSRNSDVKVVVKIGNRELKDITTEVIQTYEPAQNQIRRVANG